MFQRVFKKKDDAANVELTRKSRVEKSRRPRTASPSTASSSRSRWSRAISPDSRRSLPEGSISRREISSNYGPTLDELCRPAILDRSASSVSCDIRNPFRSNTSESIQTISISRTTTRDSSIESGILVQRAVPTYYATPIEGSLNPEPHRAAIFTRGAQCNPETFSNEIMPTTPTESPCQDGKRHHRSFMKYPKHDFLSIHIPSGIFSPPSRENRNLLWSRA